MEERKILRRFGERVGYSEAEIAEIKEGDARLRLIERLGQVAAR